MARGHLVWPQEISYDHKRYLMAIGNLLRMAIGDRLWTGRAHRHPLGPMGSLGKCENASFSDWAWVKLVVHVVIARLSFLCMEEELQYTNLRRQSISIGDLGHFYGHRRCPMAMRSPAYVRTITARKSFFEAGNHQEIWNSFENIYIFSNHFRFSYFRSTSEFQGSELK